MPGLVLEVEGTKLAGCAWHPRFSTYEVLVHVVVGPAIVRSLFASERLQRADVPEAGVGHGFSVDVGAFGVAAERIEEVKLLIGETDEWLPLSEPEEHDDAEITVEEIIGAPFRRPWVSGKIYFDAQLAGLSPETIVDLLYRDNLGRPADPDGLAHYSARIKDGSLTYEAFRRILVGAQEYTQRRWQAHEAPGAIFSQRIVLRAGREYEAEKEGKKAKELTVSLRRLCALDGIEFIVEAARQLSGKLPDSRTAWRLLAELRRGRQKADIIRELLGQPAALARNIRFADLVEEAPARAERGRKERLRLVAGSARGKERQGAPVLVPLIELLQLDGAKFVGEAYRRILGRAPGAGEAAFCAKELAAGGRKREIILFLAGEPEAIARNVRIVERPDLARGRAARPAAVALAAAAPAAGGAPDDVVGFGEAGTPPRGPAPQPEPLLFERAEPAEDAEDAAAAAAGEAAAGEAAGGAIVVLPELLALEDAAFVDAAYRQILGRAPGEEALGLHLAELAEGLDKGDFVRALAEDLAAATRGVQLAVDAEAAAAMAAEAAGANGGLAGFDDLAGC